MSPLPAPAVRQNGLRQSQRVLLSIGVEVRGEGFGDEQFSELTHTLVVNAHGALIPLNANVTIGQLLTIKNLKTQEELYCRVANLGSSQEGTTTIGIKFLQPAPRFWRIAFPPADWSSHSAEAKRLAARVTLQRTA